MKYYIKNFIGGLLLIIGMGISIDYNLNSLGTILILLPGWIILFLFNE